MMRCGSFPEKGNSNIVLIIGTPNKVPLVLGNPHVEIWQELCRDPAWGMSLNRNPESQSLHPRSQTLI